MIKNRVEYRARKVGDMMGIFDELKKEYDLKHDVVYIRCMAYLLKLSPPTPTLSSVKMYDKFDDWFYKNLRTFRSTGPKHKKTIELLIDTLHDIKNSYNSALNTETWNWDQVDLIFEAVNDIKDIIKILKSIRVAYRISTR
jgi:hypothetical protein